MRWAAGRFRARAHDSKRRISRTAQGRFKPLGELAGLVHVLLLLERIDQIDRWEEPDLLAVILDCLHAERGGDMRVAENACHPVDICW